MGHVPVSDDLATWLLDRIAEDRKREHGAYVAPFDFRCPECGEAVEATYKRGEPAKVRCERGHDVTDAYTAALTQASDRRALNECEAKRAVVDRYRRAASAKAHGVVNPASLASEVAWHDALRLLAVPYAGVPGYRQEWAPRGWGGHAAPSGDE